MHGPDAGDPPPHNPIGNLPPPREFHGSSPVVVQVVAAEKPAAGPSPKKGGWERFIQLMPLLGPLALLVVGYALTGRVANAIQQRQLELNNVKEMQSLLAKLYEKQSPEELASTVSALTAFRDYAVPPLTHLLQSPEPNLRTAAESGLRTLALGDSAAVARQLLRIVGSRNRICSWRMLQSSVRLLGDLGCRQAMPALQDLLRRVSGADREQAAEAIASITNPDAPPDAANADELKAEIETAIDRIKPRSTEGAKP